MRAALVGILLNPCVQIAAVEVNPAPHPHYRNVALKDEMLDGLLGTSQIDGGLLYVQQDRLNVGWSKACKLQPEQRGYFPCYGSDQYGH